MILELLEWAVTPCPWFARRHGLLAAQIAIRHRAKRCRAAWNGHLEACKKFVTEAVGSLPADENLVILGSGHLNDFDFAFLQRRFQNITLIDAVHPLAGFVCARRISPSLAPRSRIWFPARVGRFRVVCSRNCPSFPPTTPPPSSNSISRFCENLPKPCSFRMFRNASELVLGDPCSPTIPSPTPPPSGFGRLLQPASPGRWRKNDLFTLSR